MARKLEWGVRGVFLPMITPFQEDLSIDWEGVDSLVEWAIEEVGVDGLVPVGTTGESPTLSHQEHVDVIRRVVAKAAGRVPVMPGTGSNSTREAIALTLAAKEAGADASLQVTPYYNKPTQEQLYDHFSAVAREADLPIILYNIPGRTSRNIDPQTTIRLFKEVPQVVGTKEASGDLQLAMTVLAETDDSFMMYSGEDIMTFALLCHGGAGAIAAVAHVVGKETSEMCRAVWAGDLERARELHFRTMPVVRALFVEPNPIPVKQAVAWLGLPAGPLRPPLGPLSSAGSELLRREMQAGGWL